MAIRAARGGVGNVTGIDLRSMKLTDPPQAVADLRGLGWQIPGQLLAGDPETPVPVTVPDLTTDGDDPLLFGKQMRSRVSGWTTRTLASKPVKKTPPAARLAALFLAAHASSKLRGTLPDDLPDTCRAALPGLLSKNFLADLSGDHYRLDAGVRHLAGLLPHLADPQEPEAPTPPQRVPGQLQISPAGWTQWKAKASPALRGHAEAAENCLLSALPIDQVAAACASTRRPVPAPRYVREAYGEWKEKHPDRGPLAAQFTVTFRAEHGHGPSYNQLCTGLGWDLSRTLRTFIVRRLLANEWLTETVPKPWTLRPGNTAQAHGIALPGKSLQTSR